MTQIFSSICEICGFYPEDDTISAINHEQKPIKLCSIPSAPLRLCVNIPCVK